MRIGQMCLESLYQFVIAIGIFKLHASLYTLMPNIINIDIVGTQKYCSVEQPKHNIKLAEKIILQFYTQKICVS